MRMQHLGKFSTSGSLLGLRYIESDSGRCVLFLKVGHWRTPQNVLDDLATLPDVEVRTAQRWVNDGHVVTNAGFSAGIDMALHLVTRFEEPPVPGRAHVLEHAWADGTDTS
ncbi:hypothetical protein [Streptomyces sp. NPDC004250]|uniref:hypothetical protein n=1 Tax=Streptomyces sp. NPDC004250 TaxID=3364692 RepID=UPI00368BD908